MKLIIDRFEDKIAVCEDENGNVCNLKDYPKDAKEGSCIVLKNGSYVVDEEETKRLKDNADKLLDSLFN